MNHIILEGFMGSGKGTIGKKLASTLGVELIDVDKRIAERMKMTSAEIYDRFGDVYYRAMETFILTELAEEKDRAVLVVGSGLPTMPQNVEHLASLGTVYYLHADEPVILSKLTRSKKNDWIAERDDLKERAMRLLKEREPAYLAVADVVIDIGRHKVQEVVDEIVALDEKKRRKKPVAKKLEAIEALYAKAPQTRKASGKEKTKVPSEETVAEKKKATKEPKKETKKKEEKKTKSASPQKAAKTVEIKKQPKKVPKGKEEAKKMAEAKAKKAAVKKTTAKKAAPAKKAVAKKAPAKKATAAKKTTAKSPAKKAVAKKATTAKKAVAKKVTAAKKTVAKKATAAKKTVAKKATAAKKTVAKKATAAKKTVAKKATAAKKTVAKKAPAKKAVAKKAPAKKAVAKKAPAKKAPAKKASAKKTTKK